MRRRVAGLALVLAGLALAGGAGAQARGAWPRSVNGIVHRVVRSGCGQAWTGDEAFSHVTLDVDGHGLARLRVASQLHSAAGGVALLDEGGRYHTERDATLELTWSGRARVERGVLVVRLRSLVETVPVDGTSTTVTNRTTEEAVLRCAREERDVLAATRPDDVVDEPTTGRRSLAVCTFDAREHEGPLPRPVHDVLTLPFFLDAGAGITTDAGYEHFVSDHPAWLRAREPGGPDPG